MTLEVVEIMLSQNVWIKLSSGVIPHSRRMKSSALNSLCIRLQKLYCSACTHTKDQNLTYFSFYLVNIIAIITIMSMV